MILVDQFVLSIMRRYELLLMPWAVCCLIKTIHTPKYLTIMGFR